MTVLINKEEDIGNPWQRKDGTTFYIRLGAKTQSVFPQGLSDSSLFSPYRTLIDNVLVNTSKLFMTEEGVKKGSAF